MGRKRNFLSSGRTRTRGSVRYECRGSVVQDDGEPWKMCSYEHTHSIGLDVAGNYGEKRQDYCAIKEKIPFKFYKTAVKNGNVRIRVLGTLNKKKEIKR